MHTTREASWCRRPSNKENCNLRRILTSSINCQHLLVKVLVCWGSCNEIPDWAAPNNRHLFLTVWGRKSKVKAPAQTRSGEDPPCGHRHWLSNLSSHRGCGQSSPESLLQVVLIPLTRAPPQGPHRLPKAHLTPAP